MEEESILFLFNLLKVESCRITRVEICNSIKVDFHHIFRVELCNRVKVVFYKTVRVGLPKIGQLHLLIININWLERIKLIKLLGETSTGRCQGAEVDLSECCPNKFKQWGFIRIYVYSRCTV